MVREWEPTFNCYKAAQKVAGRELDKLQALAPNLEREVRRCTQELAVTQKGWRCNVVERERPQSAPAKRGRSKGEKRRRRPQSAQPAAPPDRLAGSTYAIDFRFRPPVPTGEVV